MNSNAFFSGEFDMKLSSDIFKINILVFEYNDIYKGYIKKIKFENEENNLQKPIFFVKYSEINQIGHFDLVIKKDYNIYNLKKFDICFVNSNLLIKVDENIWEKLYNK